MDGLAVIFYLVGILLILASLLQAVFRDWTNPDKGYARRYATGLLLLAVAGAIVGAATAEAKASGMLGSMVASVVFSVLMFGIFPTIIASPFIWWARHKGQLKQDRQTRQREEKEQRERERKRNAPVLLCCIWRRRTTARLPLRR